MALDVVTNDASALTEEDLEELAGMDEAFTAEELLQAQEDWVLITTARFGNALHGFTFATLERIGVPDDLVGRVEGKSSLGRLGLLIHSTAGFIDAGFDGHITLELANVASLPITLYPGMKIGQVSFMQMTSPADHPYGQGAAGSKYQGQRGPTPSQYFENFR